MTINRKLRGIRDPVDPGYILGRPKNMGKGPAVQLKAPPGLLTPQQNVDVLGGLPASGVTAGSYTNANITVSAKGIITAAGNGSATLPALNDGQIWIGNGANVAVARTPSGDVTVSDTGVTAIGANKVAVAQMHASATDVLFGRSSAGAGAGEEIALTSAGRALIDDASASAQRTTLGLGNVAVINLDGNATHYLDGTGNFTTPSGASGANPTATASDTAVNGSASTFMRSDGAPAVQKTSSSVFGLCKVDGTTITAASGVITAVAGTPSFNGARVKLAGSKTAQNYTTLTAIPFDAELFDVGGWHDNVTNNTRLTVPSGVAYVLVMGNVRTDNNADAAMTLQIRLNGTTAIANGINHQFTTNACSMSVQAIYNVSAGDYFELQLQVPSDTSIDVNVSPTFFSIQAIG